MLLFLCDIKQSDLAIKIGVPQPTLSNYTRILDEDYSVNFEVLENIAAYFNELLDIELGPMDLLRPYSPDLFLIEGINA